MVSGIKLLGMNKLKTFFALFAAGGILLFCGCASHEKPVAARINFATYNMLYAPDIKSPKSYGGAWSLRRGLIADIIKRNGFDIVASQELTKEQVLDFASLLGPEYAYAEERLKGLGEFDKSVLAGRKAPKNDKIELSMHNAIWYKPARFDVLDKGAFYLSATPDKFSFGFDKVDGQHRRCVWAKFLDKASGAEFFVFNVHTNSMDYPQDAERLKSARVIISQIEKIAGKDPFILCGDFNAFDTSESMRAYLSDGRFSDARAASKTPPQGTRNSYSQFGKYDTDPDYDRIDYIFLSSRFTPLDYRVISGKLNGHYPSDHYPVCSLLELKL